MTARKHTWLLAALLAGGVGSAQCCVGNIGDAPDGSSLSGPGVTPQTCGDGMLTIAEVPLRRLSRAQYRNTLRDLFGDAELDFELEDGPGVITERAVRQIRTAAELAITRQGQWTKPVFPCALNGEGSTECTDEFINTFGRRAFRRDINNADRSWLRGIFDGVRTKASFKESMEVLLQVMLQSAQTVYIFETGYGDEVAPNVHALSDYEVASRLSYFLWNTMPDDALLDAAKSGQLSTDEGLSEQAQRLLAHPRAEQNIQRFFSTWLQLDGGRLHHALEDTDKDAALYPEYDAQLQQAMRTEMEAFVRRTFFDQAGSFDDLLNGTYAYVNGPLATLYGIDGVTGDDFQWVDLESTERAGLFTRAAFLTVYSTKTVTAPIRRGVWVMENALCNELGDPPPNADDTPVEGGVVDGKELTVREDVAARTADQECQACHGYINPIGFAFENYDAIGRFQTNEVGSGLPIDSSGALNASDVDGSVNGLLELTTKLSESDQVKTCFASRWAESAFRIPHLDSCSDERIREQFLATGDMKQLVVSIIESNAFRFISTSENAK